MLAPNRYWRSIYWICINQQLFMQIPCCLWAKSSDILTLLVLGRRFGIDWSISDGYIDICVLCVTRLSQNIHQIIKQTEAEELELWQSEVKFLERDSDEWVQKNNDLESVLRNFLVLSQGHSYETAKLIKERMPTHPSPLSLGEISLEIFMPKVKCSFLIIVILGSFFRFGPAKVEDLWSGTPNWISIPILKSKPQRSDPTHAHSCRVIYKTLDVAISSVAPWTVWLGSVTRSVGRLLDEWHS